LKFLAVVKVWHVFWKTVRKLLGLPSCSIEGREMYSYYLSIDIKEDKINEFVEFMTPLLGEIREGEGCLELNMHKDIENGNNYGVIAEWSDERSMELHFKKKHFSLIIGAARVLGKDFRLTINETSEKGSSHLAREKIDNLIRDIL